MLCSSWFVDVSGSGVMRRVCALAVEAERVIWLAGDRVARQYVVSTRAHDHVCGIRVRDQVTKEWRAGFRLDRWKDAASAADGVSA